MLVCSVALVNSRADTMTCQNQNNKCWFCLGDKTKCIKNTKTRFGTFLRDSSEASSWARQLQLHCQDTKDKDKRYG